jgi:hypothetical protein
MLILSKRVFMMHKSLSLRFLFILGLLVASQIISIFPAMSASPACDATFMETLRQRGWREAQREIMMNESFIYKPDSVFALSCFTDALNRVPNSFTAGNPTQPTRDALDNYMRAHFSHGTLGGGAAAPQNTTNCGLMLQVWVDAKCRNVNSSAFTGFDFATLATTEPRVNNPQTCNGNPTGTWTSTNNRMTTVGAGAPFDNARLFLSITDPLASLSASTNCSPGILTGVKIANRYDEKVCPNPGCVPVSTGGNTMKCCDQNNTTSRCEP